VIASYLYLFSHLYHENYTVNQQHLQSRSRVAIAEPVASSRVHDPVAPPNTPEPCSMYSRDCNPTGAVPGLDPLAVSLGLLHSTPEDAYSPMLESWMNNKLVVAERDRWDKKTEQKKQAAQTKEEKQEPTLKQRRTFGGHADRL
jgi:hypothetical protein